jgi:dihydroflavonol-4-reductase
MLTRRNDFHTIGPMKVFLTGGTGFIGAHLVDLLLARDMEVYVLVRNSEKESALLKKEVRVVRGDLFSIPPLPAGLDIVFHLAGKTRSLNSAGYYTVNQEGTASLFRSLRRLKERPKVILLSSQAAAGPSLEGRPVKESDPPRPVTPYGWSKLRGEQEALKFKNEFPVAIVRASSVFGPQDRDFLSYFKVAARGLVLGYGGKRVLSLVYIKDLAEALLLCVQKSYPSGEIFNIADPKPHTWEELGIAAASAVGRRYLKVRLPDSVYYLGILIAEAGSRLARTPPILDRDKIRVMIQPSWLLDVNKAAEMLSFRTRYPLDEAVRETISWYMAERWI